MAAISSAFSGLELGETHIREGGRAETSVKIHGVDLNTKINEMAKKVKEKAQDYEEDIKTNAKRLSAVKELETGVKDLQDILQGLSGYLGVDQTVPNLFKRFYAKYANNDNSIAVSVDGSVKPEHIGTLNLRVIQVATADSLKSDAAHVFADTTSALNLNGNIVIQGVAISLTPDMTLAQVREAINAQAAQTNVRADIMSTDLVHNNQFRLVLRATNLATPIDLTGTDPTFFTRGGGVSSLWLPTTTTPVDQLMAQIDYNGDIITSKSNSLKNISPELQGVSFDLYASGVTNTVTIEPDRSAIKGAVMAFKEAFNAVNAMVVKHEKKGADGKPDSDALLFGTQVIDGVRSFLSSVSTTLAIGIKGGAYQSLEDIGITVGKMSADGKTHDLRAGLFVDESKLETAIYSNFEAFEKLMRLDFKSTNSNFTVYQLPQRMPAALANTAITVTYTRRLDGTYSAQLSVPGQTPVAIDMIQKLIEGPKGTLFEGLTIGFKAIDLPIGGTQTTQISLSQGIADQLRSTLDGALQRRRSIQDAPRGIFDGEEDRILSDDVTKKQQIDDINARADDMVKRLSSGAGAVYEQFARTQSILQMLELAQDVQGAK